MSDEKEFFDPEKNPMIYTPAPEIDAEKISPFDDLGLAPFEISESPERLTEKLAAACPGDVLIEIDASLTLMKNAAGGYMTAQGYPLQNLPTGDLEKIAAFLAGRESK